MKAQEEIFHIALRNRDRRFDGKFFVGVKTTGIYCRPICPARPKPQNVEFFKDAFSAERAGYRACLRCRPECSPLSAAWRGKTAVVGRALKQISQNNIFEINEDHFAEQFGISARHLRRLFVEELGKTPRQIAHNNRLGHARKQILKTHTSITEIAFAVGFSSIRRFNDAFKKRFRLSPLQLRRNNHESHSQKN